MIGGHVTEEEQAASGKKDACHRQRQAPVKKAAAFSSPLHIITSGVAVVGEDDDDCTYTVRTALHQRAPLTVRGVWTVERTTSNKHTSSCGFANNYVN